MATFLIALIQTALKFILFIGIATAGVICGKKFKDRKKQQ